MTNIDTIREALELARGDYYNLSTADAEDTMDGLKLYAKDDMAVVDKALAALDQLYIEIKRLEEALQNEYESQAGASL